MFKTSWKYSLNTEARRIIQCAHQMIVGFYRINNFQVLPYGHPLHTPSTVPFPDLNYHTIPRFWDKVRKIYVDAFPIKADEELINSIKKLLQQDPLPQPRFTHIETIWEKTSADIFQEIYRIIPSKKNAITTLTIYPTVIGTTSSFDWPKTFPSPLSLYLRQDQDIYTITEAVLSAITRRNVYENLAGLWQESELLVDWLVTESNLAGILRKYQSKTSFLPTIHNIREKQNARILKESEFFYKKLGLPTDYKVFQLDKGMILIHGNPIVGLTKREELILIQLIAHSNTIVTIDDLSEIVFENEDKFSLWALAKVVQRLRDKLEINGISGSYIQTLRGHGYMLKN